MTASFQAHFDYIIVGAGSAGAALAARLAEFKELRILLLEAGAWRNHIKFRLPLLTPFALEDPETTRYFLTEPEPGLAGRRLRWPRGCGIGGSTLINGMLWVRGDRQEYDNWAAMGCEGWGYDDVLPYFKRSESYAGGDEATRGKFGPVQVTQRYPKDRLTDAFLQACECAGIRRLADYNEGIFDGAGYLQFNIRNGLRYGTDRAYLSSVRHKENLVIRDGATVSRILFDGKRASGVVFNEKHGRFHVSASREVILCCGAIQSPQLLELSGIGNHDILCNRGISTLVHLPGVGENLRDHLNARLGFLTTFQGTLNQVQHSLVWKVRAGLDWLRHRGGAFSMIGATAHALVRTQQKLQRPDAKIQLLHYSANPSAGNLVKTLDRSSGFSISHFVLRPQSVGSCHIATPDCSTDPVIRANYLTHDQDVKTTIDAVRLIYKLIASKAFEGLILSHEQPDLSSATDDDIIQWVRETGVTSYHPIGTCSMGTGANSVVDSELKVRGVSGLRIADASIMPTMPSSNTQAPSTMIGEKAAELILKQAGLS